MEILLRKIRNNPKELKEVTFYKNPKQNNLKS